MSRDQTPTPETLRTAADLQRRLDAYACAAGVAPADVARRAFEERQAAHDGVHTESQGAPTAFDVLSRAGSSAAAWATPTRRLISPPTPSTWRASVVPDRAVVETGPLVAIVRAQTEAHDPCVAPHDAEDRGRSAATALRQGGARPGPSPPLTPCRFRFRAFPLMWYLNLQGRDHARPASCDERTISDGSGSFAARKPHRRVAGPAPCRPTSIRGT